MKRLSKKIRIIALIACIALALSFLSVYLCGAFEISQLNRNSELSQKLLEKKDRVGLENYTLSITDEMGSGKYYVSSDGCHRIYISSYPDAAFFSSRVTAISIEEGCPDNLLGIGIGTPARVIYAMLDKYNYRVLKGSDGFITAEKGRIKISVKLNDGGCAQTVIASLDVSNITGVDF